MSLKPRNYPLLTGQPFLRRPAAPTTTASLTRVASQPLNMARVAVQYQIPERKPVRLPQRLSQEFINPQDTGKVWPVKRSSIGGERMESPVIDKENVDANKQVIRKREEKRTMSNDGKPICNLKRNHYLHDMKKRCSSLRPKRIDYHNGVPSQSVEAPDDLVVFDQEDQLLHDVEEKKMTPPLIETLKSEPIYPKENSGSKYCNEDPYQYYSPSLSANSIRTFEEDGAHYEGFTFESQKHGRGKLVNVEGECYIGEFDHGKREGFGTLTNKKGDKIYEGFWRNDLYEGSGIEYNLNVKLRAAENTKRTELGVLDLESWMSYEGNFDAGKWSGYGTLNFINGDIYSCLLYTSDAADDLLCVDLGGRRIIKKKKKYILELL
eukprot:TRINITY_DN1588_c0_g2_i2.p1 TRINITY_DN1588_c0_g2~~TRINITY_DN1588_c0_g2_i2.p1  ORF type:complete len:379 (+),score=103.49 TRINITY_DN1588_c0_g2_i2:36-1172(+)